MFANTAMFCDEYQIVVYELWSAAVRYCFTLNKDGPRTINLLYVEEEQSYYALKVC